MIVGVLEFNYRALVEAYYLWALRSDLELIAKFVMEDEESAKRAALGT